MDFDFELLACLVNILRSDLLEQQTLAFVDLPQSPFLDILSKILEFGYLLISLNLHLLHSVQYFVHLILSVLPA